MRRPLLFTSLLLVLGTGARAEALDIRWSGDGRYTHQGSVAAGKFVEVCGKLQAGLKVQWEFDASAPVDFNVHYHLGKEVVFPAKLTAVTTAKDLLETKVEQDYCWMWTNKSAAPATLSVKLQR